MMLLFRWDEEEMEAVPATLPEPAQRPKRPGATAMEYVVMLSFIFLAVILAVQHIGNLTGSSLANSAKKTDLIKK